MKTLFGAVYLVARQADLFGRATHESQDLRYNQFNGFVTLHNDEEAFFSLPQLILCLANRGHILPFLKIQVDLVISAYPTFQNSNLNYGDAKKKVYEKIKLAHFMLASIVLCDRYIAYYTPVARYLSEGGIYGAHRYLELCQTNLGKDVLKIVNDLEAFMLANSISIDDYEDCLRHMDLESRSDNNHSDLKGQKFLRKHQILYLIRFARVRNLCTS